MSTLWNFTSTVGVTHATRTGPAIWRQTEGNLSNSRVTGMTCSDGSINSVVQTSIDYSYKVSIQINK